MEVGIRKSGDQVCKGGAIRLRWGGLCIDYLLLMIDSRWVGICDIRQGGGGIGEIGKRGLFEENGRLINHKNHNELRGFSVLICGCP